MNDVHSYIVFHLVLWRLQPSGEDIGAQVETFSGLLHHC